jgi:hypothetical protein
MRTVEATPKASGLASPVVDSEHKIDQQGDGEGDQNRETEELIGTEPVRAPRGVGTTVIRRIPESIQTEPWPLVVDVLEMTPEFALRDLGWKPALVGDLPDHAARHRHIQAAVVYPPLAPSAAATIDRRDAPSHRHLYPLHMPLA